MRYLSAVLAVGLAVICGGCDDGNSSSTLGGSPRPQPDTRPAAPQPSEQELKQSVQAAQGRLEAAKQAVLASVRDTPKHRELTKEIARLDDEKTQVKKAVRPTCSSASAQRGTRLGQSLSRWRTRRLQMTGMSLLRGSRLSGTRPSTSRYAMRARVAVR